MAQRKAKAGTAPAPAAKGKAAPQVVGADQSANPNAAATGAYPVLSPLRFDGRLYGPDDLDANVVEMTPDQAEPLQPLGVLGDRLA